MPVNHLVVIRLRGYVAFVTQTEMDHAQAIVDELLNVVVGQAQLPLTFCKSERENLFFTAVADTIHQPQTFLELLEKLYIAFAQAQENMSNNTTCACQACRLIPALGLKIVVHSGEFQPLTIHDQVDLVGAGTMWARHLQASGDEPNLKAWVYLTDTAVTSLNMTELVAVMPRRLWQRADLGEMGGVVHDLAPCWQMWHDQHPLMVDPETAWLSETTEIPVTPDRAWDYITAAQYRRYWLMADSVVARDRHNGRIGAGSTHICVHGPVRLNQLIVDWRPFDYFTLDFSLIFNSRQRQTFQIQPSPGGGTEVRWLAGPLMTVNGQTGPLQRLLWSFLGNMMRKRFHRGAEQIRQLIASEKATN
jgi:hypothetical protein